MTPHEVSGSPETPPTGFILTSAVTIIDRTRMAVPTDSLSDATTLVLRRRHRGTPIVELSPVHTQRPSDGTGPLFENRRWYVTPHGLVRVPSESPELTTYKLKFHDFSIISADSGAVMPRTASLDAVLAAVQALANRHVHPLQLTSSLPGFITRTIEPEEFESEPEDEESPALDDDTHSPKLQWLTRVLEPILQWLTRVLEPLKKLRTTDKNDHDELTDLIFVPANGEPEPDIDESERVAVPPRPMTPPRIPSNPHAGSRWAWLRRRKPLTVIAVVVVLILAIASLVVFTQHDTDNALPAEVTVMDSAAPADTDLLEGYDNELWSIGPEKAAALSWFGAGVAYVDKKSGDLVLADPATGESRGKADLDSAVEYTAEFFVGDIPAVAARTEQSVTVLTAKGTSQTWPVKDDQTVSIAGSTPMLTGDNGAVHALVVGEKKPVEITANPEFIPAAIDDSTLLQYAADRPEIVSIPFGEDTGDPSTLRLPAPVDEAIFSEHLSTGHGYAVTLWTVQDRALVAVHNLAEDGQVTSTFEAPAAAEAWKIGRGMQTAILGPYAIDLATGAPTSHSGTDFVTALGPLAVAESDSGRTYMRDNHSFTDSARVIGYTSDEIGIIRTSDGTVKAVKKGTN